MTADWGGFFVCVSFFFYFLFIFALTFHKCQIVQKPFLSFLFLRFFKVLFFLFIFALTSHKCQFVCYESGFHFLIFIFGLF